MKYVILEKARQVQVKPYQRKGKYVIGYQRFDPRQKKELLFHWTDEEGLNQIKVDDQWHGGSTTSNPNYRFEPELRHLGLIFDKRNIAKHLVTEIKEGIQAPFPEWEVKVNKKIKLDDPAFVGFVARSIRDAKKIQQIVKGEYGFEEDKNLHPIFLLDRGKLVRFNTEKEVAEANRLSRMGELFAKPSKTVKPFVEPEYHSSKWYIAYYFQNMLDNGMKIGYDDFGEFDSNLDTIEKFWDWAVGGAFDWSEMDDWWGLQEHERQELTRKGETKGKAQSRYEDKFRKVRDKILTYRNKPDWSIINHFYPDWKKDQEELEEKRKIGEVVKGMVILEKAEVKVKPHQREGRMIVGYTRRIGAKGHEIFLSQTEQKFDKEHLDIEKEFGDVRYHMWKPSGIVIPARIKAYLNTLQKHYDKISKVKGKNQLIEHSLKKAWDAFYQENYQQAAQKYGEWALMRIHQLLLGEVVKGMDMKYVILEKAAPRPGLVAKKVPVKRLGGTIQAIRWVRPGEEPEEEEKEKREEPEKEVREPKPEPEPKEALPEEQEAKMSEGMITQAKVWPSSLYETEDGEQLKKEYRDGLTPVSHIAQYEGGAVEPIVDTDFHDPAYGTVNNRLSLEVQVFSRLLGDKSDELVNKVAGELGFQEGFEMLPTTTVTKKEIEMMGLKEGKDYRFYPEEKVFKKLKKSVNPCLFSRILERGVRDGYFDDIMDVSIDPEKIADKRGLKKNGSLAYNDPKLKSKKWDKMTDRERFFTEVRMLRQGSLLGGGEDDYPVGETEEPTDPHDVLSGFGDIDSGEGKGVLSDNGKCFRSADFLLGTCNPSENCRACYAARRIRMGGIRKAFRNVLYLIKDPEGWGKKVAEETKKISKTDMPFIRLLGSGDITINQMVDGFNALAKHADRPIHIFSRRHDQLDKLHGTQTAPFIKMGSIDQDLYAHMVKAWGKERVVDNLKKGIQNAWLFTGGDNEIEQMKELNKAGALPMIFPADWKAVEKLPDELKMKCCPCDAHERNFHESCKQCSARGGGCWNHVTGALVNSKGELYTMDEQSKNPDKFKEDDWKPINLPTTADEKNAILKDAMKNIMETSKASVRAQMNKMKTDKAKKYLILKDVRFDKELIDQKNDHSDGATQFEHLAQGQLYYDTLDKVAKMAEEGTFYMPGGDMLEGRKTIGQGAVVFDKGKQIDADSPRAQEIKRLSMISKADLDPKEIKALAKKLEEEEGKPKAPKAEKPKKKTKLRIAGVES